MFVENRYERRRRRLRVLCGCIHRSFGKRAVYTGRFAFECGHHPPALTFIRILIFDIFLLGISTDCQQYYH